MLRKQLIQLRPTDNEKDEFEQLFQEYSELADFSPKRQSELIMDAAIERLKHLIASHVPSHTLTKSQSLTAQRKNAIYSMIERIKEKGYIYLMQAYAELILSQECFSDVKMRSRSSYFQSLLQAEDLFFINVSYYHETQTKAPIIIIHRQSQWFAQLKDLCFSIKEPVFKLTHDSMTDAKLRDMIFDKLQKKSKFKSNVDKAERVMLNAFLFEIGQLAEKPMYDNSDLVLREVIHLRSELQFSAAADLLQQEKSFLEPSKEKKEVQF